MALLDDIRAAIQRHTEAADAAVTAARDERDAMRAALDQAHDDRLNALVLDLHKTLDRARDELPHTLGGKPPF